MDELDKAVRGSLKGTAADDSIRRFDRVVAGWKLAMPPVAKLITDFGLGDFAHTGLIECWIANEIEAGYCGKFLFVFDGQTCPLHSHRVKHETFFIVCGEVQMMLNGTSRRMKPGMVLPVPPGEQHSFTGVGPALLLEVSKPCIVDDNYFADSRIPIGGNYRKG